MGTKYFRLASCLAASVVLASSLASCGGGGGYGGSSAATTTATTPSAGTTITLSATLAGSLETPPNMSTATGVGSVVVDSATKAMTAMVTTAGIVGTAAHIHDGAVGIAGPIIIPLTETPVGSGQWTASVTLADAQFTALQAGNYYFNVHSAAFPNGEIRGQILSAGLLY